ncbi:hypothetical protein CKO44_07720 [Rubrivivax gelatinosus]|uniref:hypothetical protein n=1 Tax=Rubrivivax gelatinosus TaxID=28068 RepID=UPI001907C78D|nr:hypothetical protein [Rubrivivax gelatinosus]MBK1613357.1 hypothetical protein [Rubrivivax gelatinosus]MBZ8143394.1 hypothetical protein [Rubrivivax gelatinosus]
MLKLLNALAAAVGWATLVCVLLAAVGVGRFMWAFDLGGESMPEADHQPAALMATVAGSAE